MNYSEPVSDKTITHKMSTHFPTVCPIVAVGASAGGLKALEQLFDTMPADTGMAFFQTTEEQASSMTPAILSALKAQTNQDCSSYKTATLKRRIAGRMAIFQLACAEDYLTILNREHTEADVSPRDFMIGVMHLFRDADAFTDLDKLVIWPLLASRSVDGPFRVWVSGCET